MALSFADESALLTELRDLVARGAYHDAATRIAALPTALVAERSPFALLAAEAHGRVGLHAAAERAAAAAVAVARARGEPYAEARGLNMRGAIALNRGDADAAEELFGAALAAGLDQPDPGLAARCLNNLGILANLRGDFVGALANYQLALAAYQQAGLLRGVVETHHNVGITRRDLGDVAGALAAADEAVRLAGEVADESLAALALLGRAETHLAGGDAPLAGAEIARARETYERVGNPVGLAEALRLEAAVARGRADLAGALDRLDRAAALAEAQGHAHTLAEIERDRASVREAQGDGDGAAAARRRAAALYRELGAVARAERLKELAGPADERR